MKYFRMSYDEVVFKRSYLNLILLNRAIPSYKPIDTKDKDDTQPDIEEILEEGDETHANDFFMKFM